MRKQTKIWLIAATFLVLVGCLIFAGVMTAMKWDFTKLSTVKYETNQHEIGENFSNVTLITDTADVVFAPSENGKTSIACYEQKKMKHSVSVQDDTLTIQLVDERKWYDYIGIFWTSPKITVYLPEGTYGAFSLKSSTGDIEIPKDYQFASMDISASTGEVKNFASVSEKMKIQTSTGCIHVENISAGMMELSVSTGKVTVTDVDCREDMTVRVSTGKASLTNVMCKNLISDGDTGDMVLKNTIASEKISIERSTGNIRFEGCDGGELTVETSTGDIKGSLLSEKVIFAQSDTGRVEVPQSTTGGVCRLTTDTGNIQIEITE